MLTVGFLAWVELVFPAWVLVLSVYMLLASVRRDRIVGPDTAPR